MTTGLSGNVTHTTKKLQQRNHCESDNEQMNVRGRVGREEVPSERREKKKISHDSRSSLQIVYAKSIPSGKSSSVSVEERDSGVPASITMEELSSGEDMMLHSSSS